MVTRYHPKWSYLDRLSASIPSRHTVQMCNVHVACSMYMYKLFYASWSTGGTSMGGLPNSPLEARMRDQINHAWLAYAFGSRCSYMMALAVLALPLLSPLSLELWRCPAHRFHPKSSASSIWQPLQPSPDLSKKHGRIADVQPMILAAHSQPTRSVG